MGGDLLKSSIGGLVRHGLGALAGYLVGAGILEAAQTETLVGAGMGLFVVGWSIVQKFMAKK